MKRDRAEVDLLCVEFAFHVAVLSHVVDVPGVEAGEQK